MGWILLAAVVGAGVGAVISYLLAERKCRAMVAAQQTNLALAEQRAGDLNQQLTNERATVDSLRSQVAASERSQASLSAQLRAAEEKCDEQRKLLDEARE